MAFSAVKHCMAGFYGRLTALPDAFGTAQALATALYHEHYKASILMPYTERICLGLMYGLYHKQARVRAAAVVSLKWTILCGQVSAAPSGRNSLYPHSLAAICPPPCLSLSGEHGESSDRGSRGRD